MTSLGRWLRVKRVRTARWFDLDVGNARRVLEATRRGTLKELGRHEDGAFDVVTVADATGWRATPDALVEISRVLASRGTLAVAGLADESAFVDCGVFPLIEHHTLEADGERTRLAVARRAAHVDRGFTHPPPPSLFVKGRPPTKVKVPLAG